MPDDLSAELGRATAALIGRPVGPGDGFGIAVSGGADSMALLALAADRWPGQVRAATVDHGLRPDSADEAAMVARWCAERGIGHETLRPDRPIAGSLQLAARKARYALLEAWRAGAGLDWLMTAHQADDQMETLLLRLNRGAGIPGLAGVRARRAAILRPLLGVSRAALRAYCEAGAIPFVDDPSNDDERFDRARMRAALEAGALLDPRGVARSARALGDAEVALDWMAARIAETHLRAENGVWRLDPAGLPREMIRRLLLRALAAANESAEIPRGPSLDQALVQLFDGKTVALADCLVAGGEKWEVRRAPPRRSL